MSRGEERESLSERLPIRQSDPGYNYGLPFLCGFLFQVLKDTDPSKHAYDLVYQKKQLGTVQFKRFK
ncbi:hypothetical protein CC1G_14258 [Coprinopsis cinerea okayama7|uniref:Uncharacterized protein n=1 Tax=Coprinopsis cinerea (strain Okayama-7 / 130 / ATCC MYA-4618 / FGSC 9003) TaxID=240176 RepID=D6RLE9_COPC7|nr:hypothetical protein CC1G_14258 [Coprinopsis cinerea okayama7\|eukprot:XP_002911727.1 hypothetical protein CC1G_14258 [Coprinopsis cinerea okayama7\